MSNAVFASAPELVRLNLEDLRERLGQLAYQRLKELDLLIVAEKLALGLPLTASEAGYLTSIDQLPVLGKLVELKVGCAGPINLRAVVALNLSEIMRGASRPDSLATAGLRLKELGSKLQPGEKFFLALDSWCGGPNFFERQIVLVKLLSAVRQNPGDSFLKILGPSSVEFLQILKEQRESFSAESGQRLLAKLRELAVTSLDGGTDLDVHLLANQHEFDCCVAQEISGWQPVEAEQFLKRLGEFQQFADQSTRQLSWFPWAPQPLDNKLQVGPLGLDLLRAIALARLLLPQHVLVRAPLSLLGIELTHVALGFGANDLGFAALDIESSRQLGIPLLSQVRTLLEGHRGLGKVSLSSTAKQQEEEKWLAR